MAHDTTMKVEILSFPANCENSDNDSNASGESETAPFEDYRLQLEQLLGSLGFPFCSIEVILHGYNYQNCVYEIGVLNDIDKKYILRVPILSDIRDSDGKCESIENDAALLQYLQDKLTIPRVEAFSAGLNNVLKKSYTILTRLRSIFLNKVYDDIDFEEKAAIVYQLVELLAKVQSIHFDRAGSFAPFCPRQSGRSEPLDLSILDIKSFEMASVT